MNAFLRRQGTGHGFRISAKAIVEGIVYQPGANGIEIDIGRHGLPAVADRFQERTLEAFCPERATAAVTAVEPDAEALFLDFHILDKEQIS